jgi:hypothetical protein
MQNKFVIIVLTSIILSSCSGDVKKTLGINKRGPDEFTVVSHPPLNVPPEFNLRPPSEFDNGHSNNQSASEEARGKIIGVVDKNNDNIFGSNSELKPTSDKNFLNKIGAEKANKNIRTQIKQDIEQGVTTKDDNYFFNFGKKDEPIVDADKEAARIKDTKAKAKPVNEGETPTVKQGGKGLLEKLF